MAGVTVYSTTWCPYCMAARSLLENKGVDFDLVDIGKAPERRSEMLERANGRHTVPQVFVGETHVGGYDDLEALERAGKLDALLAEAGTNAISTATENAKDD